MGTLCNTILAIIRYLDTFSSDILPAIWKQECLFTLAFRKYNANGVGVQVFFGVTVENYSHPLCYQIVKAAPDVS